MPVLSALSALSPIPVCRTARKRCARRFFADARGNASANLYPLSAMIAFAARIVEEQPGINAALAEAVAALPASVRPVAEHVLGPGGKRLRPLLTVFTARLLDYTESDIYPLAAAVEMFHTATLLHDDVLDNADLRRGQTAAHRRFGVAEAILAGDALLAGGNKLVAASGDPRLTSVAAEAIFQTAAGEILEIEHQGQIAGDLSTYLEIVTGKTAWMLRAACEFGAFKSGAEEARVRAAAEYGLNLGIAFQLVDDALDFSPSENTGKPEGGDVREGKFTPPLFFYHESLSQEERGVFARAFRERSFSDDEVRRVTHLVRERGYDSKTRAIADVYLDKARDALDKLTAGLPASPERDILAGFIGHVRDRDC